MIVVSSIGLSTMVTNNILIPYNLLGKLKSAETISNKSILNSRKIVIFLLIICMSFYLPQVITANATLSKSLCLKYLRFNL